MISKTAIAAIAIVAVVAVGGGIAAAILMNHGEDDSKFVIYDGNGQKMKDGGTVLKTTELKVKDSSIFGDTTKHFLVWNTKSDGTGTKYSPGDDVTLGTKLYAVWGSYQMAAGNIMLTASNLELTLYASDDISDHRDMDYFMPLSDKGEITLTMTGFKEIWQDVPTMYNLYLYDDPDHKIQMWVESDEALSVEMTVKDEHTAVIKITYNSDISVSAPYAV